MPPLRRARRRAWTGRIALAVVAVAVAGGAAAAVAQVKVPPDFPMPRAESSPGPVSFSHAKHAAVPKCAACHPKDFKMKRGASGPITLEAKQQGKSCGSCHDGKTQAGGKAVFSIEQCERCHKETPTASAPTTAMEPAPKAGSPKTESATTPAAKTSPPRTDTPKREARKTPPPRGAPAAKSDDCLACHADKDMKRSAPARPTSLFVDEAVLKGSRHAGLECVACHATATAPHDEKLPRVRCATCHEKPRHAPAEGVHGSAAAARAGRSRAPSCAACHGTHDVRAPAAAGTDLCATCHPKQVGAYRDSIHGRSRQKGNSEAATCRSCHGDTHTLLAKSDPRAPTYHLNLPRTCAGCHSNPDLARRYGIPIDNAYQLYMDSIHGRALTRSGLLVAANCSDCHGAHEIKPRTDPASRVSRVRIPETCGTCHAGITKEYRQSIHGTAAAAGNPIAPVCIDCHSAHQIRRVEAEAWKLDIVKECGTCHAESLRTYRDTFHGKVTALGFSRVARCSDCHGAHVVLPARDLASMVHPANRVKTCAKCHPAANENFARYDPHADPDNPSRNRFLYSTAWFMRWLLIGTFSFFGIHTGLWGIRSLVGGRRHG